MGMADVRAVRSRLLRRGVVLESWSLAWLAMEAAVAGAAGLAAGSIVLLAFGLDSLLEVASASVLLYRLRRELAGCDPRQTELTERRAAIFVGGTLLLLAVYIAGESGYDLWYHRAAEASVPGILLAACAIPVMWWLAKAKRSLAVELSSAALRGDAAEGVVCAWMSGAVLAGLAARAGLGWWWADPAAALTLVYFIVREGLEALRSEAR